MSLDTLNNGDSGLEARTKINAAIAAVNAGTIIRASGMLQAYTIPIFYALPPPALSMTFSGSSPGLTFNVTITVDGISKTIAFGSSDPGGVDYFIDSAFVTTPEEYAIEYWGGLNGLGLPISKTNWDGNGGIEITDSTTGNAANISGSMTSYGSVANGGSGIDETAASGETTEVILIPGVAGKKIKMVGAWYNGNIAGPTVTLVLGGATNTDISKPFPASSAGALVPADDPGPWLNGVNAGEGLSARLDGSIPEDASTGYISVIIEQY